jgi:hypothetical protein
VKLYCVKLQSASHRREPHGVYIVAASRKEAVAERIRDLRLGMSDHEIRRAFPSMRFYVIESDETLDHPCVLTWNHRDAGFEVYRDVEEALRNSHPLLYPTERIVKGPVQVGFSFPTASATVHNE